jgi:serine O-acetyltransferase
MKNIKSDLLKKSNYMYGNIKITSLVKVILSDGTSAMVIYRISSFFQRNHLPVLGMLFSRFNVILNSIVIGQGAVIGKGFVIMHTVGVVINGNAKIGKNAIIQSGVVIGSVKHKSPEIGDNVSIGAGAKIIGNVNVGNNVDIGANAVVIKDVPSNVTAVGIPAKVVRYKDADTECL